MAASLEAHPRTAVVAAASQWQLMWWSFRRHRLAVIGLVVTLLIYLVALFCEFLAPFSPHDANRHAVYHPPQSLHFFHHDAETGWEFGPFVYGFQQERDAFTLAYSYVEDRNERTRLRFFGEGAPYYMWGVIPMTRHLLVPVEPGERFYLFGADRLGRDMLSRTIYGTRISMSIGLVGVTMALVLGILLGGISGYYGGFTDTVVQRLVEFTLSLPTIPIWLALTASLPQDWSPVTRYFAITLILSLVGWAELARVVRGRFLALRTEDFVTAARLDGVGERRIIFRHMLPSLISHIIASVTLAIPLMILAETALSFLGLGLQQPIVSWGVLLREAQNVRSIAQAPWLFVPGGAVVLAVLALNFLGDGLRDAADPYAQDGR